MIDYNIISKGGQHLNMKNGAERLIDVTASGKVRPWDTKKLNNEILALVYDEVEISKAERLRECCTELYFKQFENGKKQLDRMNSCRVRLCPICTWRRSLKVYSNMMKIMSGQESSNFAFLYLTLTVKNVEGENLKETIEKVMYSWQKMSNYKKFTDVVKGYYRGFEITHNVDKTSSSYNTYHPHIHAVLAVSKEYFGKAYMKHEDWQKLWQKAIKSEYEPIIDIRKIKGNTADAVAEAAGYAVKDCHYIIPENWELTTETVKILDNALHKKRLVAYGGVLKEIHKKLNLDDEENGDLIKIGDEEIIDDKYEIVCYAWRSGYSQYLMIS